MMPKTNDDEEAAILEALAWKHNLDSGNDYEKLHRLRRRLRASDIHDLLWEFEQSQY